MLFILAMDHRDSFGKTLFGVRDDHPTPAQKTAMRSAKTLIFDGLQEAKLPYGDKGVLVDEDYGTDVIHAARATEIKLAVPIEASGQDWFTPEFGSAWVAHLEEIRPDYAKVLVRDNPAFPSGPRSQQLDMLADVTGRLSTIGVPLLYELLVPATPDQLPGGDTFRYDRDVRPSLVVQVIAENQAHGVNPRLWKVEGLESVADCEAVAAQATAGDSELIVLGRDAPAERLNHWLEVAGQVPAFTGFAIGRSIWEEPIRDYEASAKDPAAAATARSAIAARYEGFAQHWPAPRN
jgi:myo-inositol catabolism protein IolC